LSSFSDPSYGQFNRSLNGFHLAGKGAVDPTGPGLKTKEILVAAFIISRLYFGGCHWPT
jgi:hypothetical protein